MSCEVAQRTIRLNKWKAVYIERCTYGLEGSIWKPTIVIWQGAGCLPYSDVQKQFFLKQIKGRGYVDKGDNVISEFYTPLVPKEHDFLNEIAKLAQ